MGDELARRALGANESLGSLLCATLERREIDRRLTHRCARANLDCFGRSRIDLSGNKCPELRLDIHP